MAADVVRARFLRAMYVLATGTAPLPERVSAAWVELLPLQRGELPIALQEPYAAIEAEMLAAPDDPATLDEEAAIAAAERIFRLAVELWGG